MWYNIALAAIVILNLPSHYFLVRLFRFHNPKSWLNSGWIKYPLLVPPLSIIVAGFLVTLGTILRICGK